MRVAIRIINMLWFAINQSLGNVFLIINPHNDQMRFKGCETLDTPSRIDG